MNINDLVTHYITFRRTLGERCRTKEFILRAFCRAVGLRTHVKKARLKDVAAFLAGTGGTVQPRSQAGDSDPRGRGTKRRSPGA